MFINNSGLPTPRTSDVEESSGALRFLVRVGALDLSRISARRLCATIQEWLSHQPKHLPLVSIASFFDVVF